MTENAPAAPAQAVTQTPRDIKIELFILSFLSLFVELLIIRWFGGDIRAFAIFHTFPLIACFVGLGVGCALRDDKLFKLTPDAIFLTAVVIKLAEMVGVSFWGFPSASVFQWQNLVVYSQEKWFIVAFMAAMIVLLAPPFALCVYIGARLGVLFDKLPALSAYGINVLGAICGSIAFPILCFLGLPPWLLIATAGLALSAECYYVSKRFRWQYLMPLAIVPIFMFVQGEHAKPLIPALFSVPHENTRTYWSPYQRLDLTVFHAPESIEVKGGPILDRDVSSGKSSFLGLELGVNRAFYQWYFNPNVDASKTDLKGLLEPLFQTYELAFNLNQPKRALVVGAGTGQNVSAGLKRGVEHIDAVDIDPVILELGRKYNPDYADPRVKLICDDARHFFRVADTKYDTIVFSLLDSQAVSALGSSVRIDTYVYTRESIRKALSLLNPGGVIVLWYATPASWTKARLYHTLTDAAGYEPALLHGPWPNSNIFVLGDPVKEGKLQVPGEAKLASTEDLRSGDNHVLTDDWPYLYVNNTVVDVPYWLVVAEIVGLGLFAARKFILRKAAPVYWQMFFMGSAFLLLELHAISFLSLLYGSTWITSAIVINGILLMIYLANLMVIKANIAGLRANVLVYSILIGSILLSYFLPGESVMDAFHGGPLAYAIVTLVTLAPMGIAAIVFSAGFKRADDTPRALAFNLCGAVIGGLLEYFSNYTGIKALELVAAALYLVAFFCAWRSFAGEEPVGESITEYAK